MFIFSSAFGCLLKYAAFISLWPLGLCACKDFKSWESRYNHEVKIKFSEAKDPYVPQVYNSLQSYKLSELEFRKQPIVAGKDNPMKLAGGGLSIPLTPDADVVSFALESTDGIYYHTVTIAYRRKLSLISPQAGGLQIQYIIEDIQLHNTINKRAIFQKFTIDNRVPLKAAQTHVTLYY